LSFIESFCQGRKVVVAGSTWEEDEEELVHFSNTSKSVAFIIAPHLVDQENIRDVSKRFRNSICYSQLVKGEPAEGKNVLIIDNIGMLSQLYRYADISYVGGGFGNDGIHNILEPAAYGKPVIIGPVHDKFFEARELIEAGGCFSVKNALELESLLNKLLNEPNFLQQAGNASSVYVSRNKGATEKILHYIQANRLLIN
jgi:3-deoxy-D-manno-octulosonic-acid transferase